MPSKFQMYRQMAEEAARQVTGSYNGWTSFLTTAARLYKYPYNEQLMIHAQRPDATACAEYDFWNEKMGRYVRRNSQGIALIDTRNGEPKLKYVFDVSDTGSMARTRPVWLWQLTEENADRVSAMLEQNYDVPGEHGIREQLENVATRLVNEYWNDNSRDVFDIIDDSFLEEYDNYNIEVAFRNAAVVSSTYALMSRCGLDPDEYFTHEDFLNVFDFNTPAAATVLGTAVSQINGQILRQIEACIRSFEREQSRPAQAAERMEQNDRADLHEERRLSDPGHQAERDSGGSEAPGQIWASEEGISERTPSDPVEQHDSDRDTVPAFEGDRRDGTPPLGADDAGADETERCDGETESQRPDDVGGLNEQPESTGRGNDSERADLQLSPFGAATGRGEQLSLFPTEDEQIAYLQQAEDVNYTPFVFSMSVPQEDLDHILRLDGNTRNARMEIATEFSKGKSNEEIAAFLQKTFHGGNGIVIDDKRYSVWYGEDGIHIATGDAARYLNSAKVVTYAEAAERIGQLLEQGEYATNVELAEAPGNERIELAKSLWYLKHDLSDEAKEAGYLSVMDTLRGGGFPDETERLADGLKSQEFQSAITAEYTSFLEAYREDNSLMRFRLRNGDELLAGLQELSLPHREYNTEMAELPPFKRFITEDEIAASLTRGSGIEGGKGHIYSYFREKHSSKEQVDFLKNEYGIGGHAPAVSGEWHSSEDHSGKGISLKKGGCAEVQLNWANVAKRISELIRKDRYLTPEEKTQYEQLQRRNAERNNGWNDYNVIKEAHPDDMVLYQVGDFFEFYGEDARTAAELLNIRLTSRNIPDVGRVDMCGIPAHSLEQYVEKLRDRYDVTISAVNVDTHERSNYTLRSVDHAAEQAIDAYEAEFGADGTRAFGDTAPEEALQEPTISGVQTQLDKYVLVVREAIEQDTAYRNACGHSDRENAVIEGNAAVRRAVLNSGDMELIKAFSDNTEFRHTLYETVIEQTYSRLHEMLRPLTQDDIDDALRSWNGDLSSKQSVVRYMQDHARDRDTAAWLSREYGGSEGKSLFIVRAGSPEAMEMPWPKVQRRIAQLINENNFLTEQEQQVHTADYRLLDRLRTDCEYFLGYGERNEKHLWAGNVRAQIAKMRELYDSLPEKPEWLTEEAIDSYAERMAPPYLVVAYHHFENGFDEKLDYQTLPEAEKAVQEYVDGTMEGDGFKYDGAAIYNQQEQKYVRIYGDFPDERAQAQVLEKTERFELGMYLAPGENDKYAVWDNNTGLLFEDSDHLIHAYDTEAEALEYLEDVRGRFSEKVISEETRTQESVSIDPSDRFHVVSFDRGARTLYAVWDDETHGYYVDAEGVTEEFTSEWQAEAYRLELQGQVEQALVERAKGLINDFCQREYGEDADFSDLTRIGIAYSVTPDDEIPIQADIDLENFRLVRSLGDEHLETRQYSSLQDLIANELEGLDFGDLTYVSDEEEEQYQNRWQESETPATEELPFPYAVGDTVYLEDNKPFIIESIGRFDISLRDPTLFYPIFRAESRESFAQLMERFPQPQKEAAEPVSYHSETVAVYPAEENNLPYDVVIERLHIDEPTPPTLDDAIDGNPISVQIGGEWQTFPNKEAAETAMFEEYKDNIRRNAENFHITDDDLGVGGAKAKFRMNMDAINLLKQLEFDGMQATPEQQEVLSRYVGWGGLADAFDETKDNWKDEFAELYATLTPEEYAAARASTLNAHYTSPTVIRAIYDAVENMGFQTGNILEPSMGVGNFFGMLPDSMASSKLYGVELDSLTGRIAKQLYPKADITVAGFETTDRKDFFDLAIGNVPFGQYQVSDRAYDKLGFSIHNYFFAKALDQVRPGGVVAFVTSRYTMDAKDSKARKHLAQRADFLGAIRLPNNAFKANAGTEVVSDIIFLQKRDRPIDIEPDWVHLGENADGFAINSYFVENPDMILGRQTTESTQYGKQDFTVEPYDNLDLATQLNYAIQSIKGTYTEAELPDLGEDEKLVESIPADPNVKNFSYTVVDDEVYYRQNSIMTKPALNATARERVKGMVELRDCVQKLIGQQMDGFISDETIRQTQAELNTLYDSFTTKYGLINSRGNALAFADDNSYYLLCSLEELDEDRNLKRKADMFTKRTIKAHEVVTSVDTASEALALSISEKACVDMSYMSQLTGKDEETLASELRGVIYKDYHRKHDGSYTWRTADDFLSGNVREKLDYYVNELEFADGTDEFQYVLDNVEALKSAQPKDLDASEIEVRLGATWIDSDYIREFMWEVFETPFYQRRTIDVNYSQFTAEWNIKNKSAVSYSDITANMTYGTERANAYKILEDTLNLRDVRIYDTKYDADGKERRVLNSKETTLAQQKQQAIKDAFRDWIWKDPDRRHELVTKYNELFNSTRPREYDGSHITFTGMNPEIRLREHQLNAVAHVLYGGNTLLAHEVGAGKTFEMVAAAMESKRLGLCQKSLFAVPNHLTEQWSSEFLRLYPSANILVATKKDFEPKNRKKFCARIATGDYDAVIIGHSQFEKIPISMERQERLLQEQIDEIEEGLRELKASRAERFTIKSLERTKRGLETRLKKLHDSSRKDDVVTFEQLGVDRLYVDEAHNYKNLFLYTKMRNVAGLSTTDAQKSSDMLLKCRYMDELTGSRGIVFATGTPVSNSMTELYTMMRYLQHDTLREKGLAHFDAWASTFGETQTAIELAPEGTGYRARTRFARFFNLPELMTLFKEAADIKTADQLDLPRPTAIYHNEVAEPTDIQENMVQELSERAAKVHAQLVDPSQDNMLKITSDGRKLGLDQRVINPDLPDDPASKVNLCVNNIAQIYEDGKADKLTQLVFCDLSTPKTAPAQRAAKTAGGNLDSPEIDALERLIDSENPDEPSFTVYDDIREKLVAKGIPREEIAFIHEANTETRKKDLYAKVRSGQVRVLMGSTFKMGAGMNVQDRLVALHDLDCPWRPGDLEQRSGRIIRQGNSNPEVHIYRYVTEGTFDSYLWQTVENKQKFISQIMTSKSPVRSCEDVDETALSYAEIKALCAGDSRIKEKMDLDVDVARLRLMKANHQSQQYRLEDNLLKTFPEQIKQNESFIAGFEADIKTLSEHLHPTDGFAGMEVKGDMLTDKDNAGAAILEAFKDAKGMEPVPIGSYRGFAMSLTVEDFGKDFVLTLKGKMNHRVSLGKDARGNLTRIDNALNAIPERMQAVQDKLTNLYGQVETAKAELGKPFPQEEELRQKSARLAELNAELNIDDKTPMEQLAEEAPQTEIAKSKPSVLAKLNAYKEQSKPAMEKPREMER